MNSFLCIALLVPLHVVLVFAKIQTFTRNGYILIFDDKTNKFNANIKTRMVNTFFTVYPKQVNTYNRVAPKKVTFIIDPKFSGVAQTTGQVVRFAPSHFAQHPKDIDLVTHEVMHIVQAYKSNVPWWAKEGIADYVRHTMGVDNKGAGWSLTPYQPNSFMHYTHTPGVAGHFLLWMEKNVKPGIVKAYDKALRDGKHEGFFKRFTGKTIEQLWQKYSKTEPSTGGATGGPPPPPPG